MPDMALSETVPHVASTSVRRTVPADLSAAVDTWAIEHQLSSDEGLEVLLRSRLAPTGSTAAHLSTAYETGGVQSASDIEDALNDAEVGDPVIGIRLAARRTVTEREPFARDHIGADLDDDPLTVWPAARGLWRIQSRWRYLVAYRLGMPLALYRVAGWKQHTPTGRRWASEGYVIDGLRRLNADTGEYAGERTPTDAAVHQAVFAQPLATAAGAANPLVLLNSR